MPSAKMNHRPDYSSTRPIHPSQPPNLPSIHLLFQIADCPTSIPPSYSLTLPPLRFKQANIQYPCFIPPSGSSSPPSSSSSPICIQAYSRPPKRKQVKRACLNCQKACKGCADTRPCPRCVVHGLADSCVDAPRKSDRKIKKDSQ